MKILSLVLLVALSVVTTASTRAQQSGMPKNWDPSAPMTNEEVIQLVRAGVPDRFIIAKIKAAKVTHFDTSPAGLKALSDAGIHDAVVEAMISKQDAGKVETTPAPATSPAAPPADPNDPTSLHDSGVYFLNDGKLIAIEPGTFQGDKHTSTLKLLATQGLAKMRDKAVLRGPHAPTQIADPNPTFYLYFGKDDAPAMVSFSPEPKSPREYLLVKLEVAKEDRLLETLETGPGGMNMNATTKTAVKFTHTQIAPGAYKVTPDKPLAPGEYCFFSGSGTMGPMAAMGRVYDFGITSGH